jgi:hypothetical protein
MSAICQCLLSILFLALAPLAVHGQEWKVSPQYETPVRIAPFLIKDAEGTDRQMYSESHAILIFQGKYKGSWSPAEAGAKKSEALLVKTLEERGFHVMVWRDLQNAEFRQVLPDVFEKYGDAANARFFFYYYGHATTVGHPDDPAGEQLFLVPTDAASPVDESQFKRTAVSARSLLALAEVMNVKHAFFAFEACKAGTLIGALDEPPRPNPLGYLLSDSLQFPVRQFLTAGNEFENIPADAAFSALLVGAMSDRRADVNQDNFVTGSEVIGYVSANLPTYKSYPQNPEYATLPPGRRGDLIFGPVDPAMAMLPPLPKDSQGPSADYLVPTDFPTFVGMMMPTDIGNLAALEFLAENYSRNVYLDVWMIHDMNGRNYDILEACGLLDADGNLIRSSLENDEFFDEFDINSHLLPTLSDPEYIGLQSIYDLPESSRAVNVDGTLKQDAVDCYNPEVFFKPLQDPEFSSGGTGMARYHYKGVYNVDREILGGAAAYYLREIAVPEDVLIQLSIVNPQARLDF